MESLAGIMISLKLIFSAPKVAKFKDFASNILFSKLVAFSAFHSNSANCYPTVKLMNRPVTFRSLSLIIVWLQQLEVGFTSC